MFEKKKACMYYTGNAWDPTTLTVVKESYYSPEFESTIISIPKEKPFMVVAQDCNNENIYQVLYEDRIGWIRYQQWALLDTSLNP